MLNYESNANQPFILKEKIRYWKSNLSKLEKDEDELFLPILETTFTITKKQIQNLVDGLEEDLRDIETIGKKKIIRYVKGEGKTNKVKRERRENKNGL